MHHSMSSPPAFDADLSELAAALQAMPRNQARLPITLRVRQELESDTTNILKKLRVERKIDNYSAVDTCNLIQLPPPDSRWAVEYIRYDDGYITPDDLDWDYLED